MSSPVLSLWDQVELADLRWFAIALAQADRALGTEWGDRLLKRMTGRWQAQLAQINHNLALLEAERSSLLRQIEAMSIQAAVLHLGARRLARGELCFDPALPGDEQILDAAIEILVKRRMASIATYERAPGHYVYDLEPDWIAIRARLAEEEAQAAPEIAGWLGEGVRLIDGSLLRDRPPAGSEPSAEGSGGCRAGGG